METFTILLIVAASIWLFVSLMIFSHHWMDWSLEKDLRNVYQRETSGLGGWASKYAQEHDDNMIEASRKMRSSFAWPLKIFGLGSMLSYGKQMTSVEAKEEERFRLELEASVANEKSRQLAEWEREFRGG